MIGSADYLIEILEFYIYKLKRGKCATDEIESATDAIVQNMKSHGTISDFAEFYGKTENQIRATIARKLMDKPKRKVLYPFNEFAKVIPESWRKKKEE